MTNSFKLLFQLRKPKAYTSGPQPIYLRITVNGQRVEFATQRECEPSIWNRKSGRLNGNKENTRQINAYLDGLVSKIYACQQALIQNKLPVTAEALKNKLTGKGQQERSLISIFKNHNKKVEELIGIDYSAATLERYNTSLEHTINFLKWKFSANDINIEAINHEFISDYDFYLRTVKKCNNNTTVKYIKNFKKIIRICIANGWLDRDPFINFKAKVVEVERAFLSEVELDTMQKKNFSIDRLNQVKDIFLFSCYTGLAYIDVQKLKPTNIVIGIDGKHWINTHRTKTETASNIPLLPPAMQIIEKYKNNAQTIANDVLLPVLSNQKMNAYLKEIADLCEINKPLTFHVARHTFATTITLTNGIPIESVSKMLGHRSLRTTQHYAKILDKKVSADMEVLFTKMNKKTTADDVKKMA